MVEQEAVNFEVVGSSPIRPAKLNMVRLKCWLKFFSIEKLANI